VTPAPRKPGLVAEDNAVAVLSYPRALGLLEASWTQIGGEPAFAMIVYGDRGTLLVHQPRATHESQKVGHGRVQLVTTAGSRFLEPPALPPDERDGPTHFLARLRDRGAVSELCAAAIGRDVQEVITAALQSTASGRVVSLPLD
jgi:predicted dehydrogenase